MWTHRRRWELLVVLALIILAALLRFWRIGHQGFWFDEADTAMLMHDRAGAMLGLLPRTESTPPLYYCVAWVWSRVFGDTEAPLRALSALAGVLVVPALYGAARRLTRSPWIGLATGALAAANPFLVWYAQEARAYELVVLFCALAWLAFAVVLEAPRRGWLAAWALCAGLALATEYYAVVVVLPQAVVLLWRWRRRPALLAAVGFVVLVGLALVPLLRAQDHAGNASWIAHIPLGVRLGQILPQFTIGTGTPIRTPLKFLCFALALLGLAGLAARSARSGRLVAAMTLAGFLLTLVFIAAGNDTLITRNIISLWPGAAIAVATGLGMLAHEGIGRRGRAEASSATGAGRSTAARIGALAALAGLCCAGVVATVGVATTYALQRPDWRPLAALLNRRASASDSRLILIQSYSHKLPLSLDMPRLGLARAASYADVASVDVIALGSEPGGSYCWWGAGCNLSPSALQARYRIAGFRPDGISHVEQFSVLALVAARPRTVSRAEVRSALALHSLRGQTLLIQSPAPAG